MEHNSDELSEIKKILADHEKRISSLESLIQTKPGKIKKKLPIKEFILQKHPERDVDKTLVIGYYLEHYKNVSSFNVKDLEIGFREAKEPLPKNINDTVNKNMEKGYMMEAEEKKDGLKAWVLTNTGEKVVEEGFGKE
jgi:hypothetical protein